MDKLNAEMEALYESLNAVQVKRSKKNETSLGDSETGKTILAAAEQIAKDWKATPVEMKCLLAALQCYIHIISTENAIGVDSYSKVLLETLENVYANLKAEKDDASHEEVSKHLVSLLCRGASKDMNVGKYRPFLVANAKALNEESNISELLDALIAEKSLKNSLIGLAARSQEFRSREDVRKKLTETTLLMNPKNISKATDDILAFILDGKSGITVKFENKNAIVEVLVSRKKCQSAIDVYDETLGKKSSESTLGKSLLCDDAISAKCKIQLMNWLLEGSSPKFMHDAQFVSDILPAVVDYFEKKEIFKADKYGCIFFEECATFLGDVFKVQSLTRNLIRDSLNFRKLICYVFRSFVAAFRDEDDEETVGIHLVNYAIPCLVPIEDDEYEEDWDRPCRLEALLNSVLKHYDERKMPKFLAIFKRLDNTFRKHFDDFYNQDFDYMNAYFLHKRPWRPTKDIIMEPLSYYSVNVNGEDLEIPCSPSFPKPSFIGEGPINEPYPIEVLKNLLETIDPERPMVGLFSDSDNLLEDFIHTMEWTSYFEWPDASRYVMFYFRDAYYDSIYPIPSHKIPYHIRTAYPKKIKKFEAITAAKEKLIKFFAPIELTGECVDIPFYNERAVASEMKFMFPLYAQLGGLGQDRMKSALDFIKNMPK